MLCTADAKKYFASCGYALKYSTVGDFNGIKSATDNHRPCGILLADGIVNWHWILSVSSLGLIYLDKILYSIAITLGNLVGIFAGQILGDIIRNQNISKITKNTERRNGNRNKKNIPLLGNVLFIMLVISYLLQSYPWSMSDVFWP